MITCPRVPPYNSLPQVGAKMAAASVQVLRSATLGTALMGPDELGTAPSRRSFSRAGSRGFPSTRGSGSPAATRGSGTPAGAQGQHAGERRDDSPLTSSQGHVSEGHVSEVHPSPSRHPSPDGVPASGRPGMQASSADARPPLDSSASSVSSAYFGGVARRMQSPPSTPPASAYASLGGGGMCASTRSVGASSPRDGASAQRDGGVEGGRRGRPTGTCRMTPTDLRRNASRAGSKEWLWRCAGPAANGHALLRRTRLHRGRWLAEAHPRRFPLTSDGRSAQDDVGITSRGLQISRDLREISRGLQISAAHASALAPSVVGHDQSAATALVAEATAVARAPAAIAAGKGIASANASAGRPCRGAEAAAEAPTHAAEAATEWQE